MIKEVTVPILPLSEAEIVHAQKVLKHAEQARTTLLKFARRVCDEIGVDHGTSIQLGSVKDLQRAFEKAVKQEISIGEVSDLARLRIFVSTNDQILALRRIFIQGKVTNFEESAREKGIELVSLDDKFLHPNPESGYRDIQLKLKADIGKGRPAVPCEIQILHTGMEDAYAYTRKKRLEMRSLEAQAKLEKRPLTAVEREIIALNRQGRKAIHDEAALACGVYLLTDTKYAFDGQKVPPKKSKGRAPAAP